MQTTSGITNYDTIVASGEYHSESKLVINNVEYGENLIMSLKTIRGVFDDNIPTIGNAYVGRIDATVRLQTGVMIPKAAEVKVYIRIFNSTLTSGWLPKGVFYIYQREVNSDNTVMRFVGFDGMFKGNAIYPSSTLEWSVDSPTPRAVLNEIAATLGVELDNRTKVAIPTTSAYTMLFPAQFNMREVLQSIAVIYMGNFCMSDTGELLFVGIADIAEPTPTPSVVTYTIEFYPNGSGVTGYVPKIVESGDDPETGFLYTLSSSPSRDGYTFTEWNTASDGSGTGFETGDTIAINPNETVKLWAQWNSALVNYSITYVANETNVTNMPSPNPQVDPSLESPHYVRVSNTVPQKIDPDHEWIFEGWGVSARDSATYLPGNSIARSSSNPSITLYGVWAMKYDPVLGDYYLYYNGNGEGDIVTNLPTTDHVPDAPVFMVSSIEPSRTGYTFLGWSENPDAASSDTLLRYPDFYEPTGSGTEFVLYAIWDSGSTPTDYLVDENGDSLVFGDDRILV